MYFLLFFLLTYFIRSQKRIRRVGQCSFVSVWSCLGKSSQLQRGSTSVLICWKTKYTMYMIVKIMTKNFGNPRDSPFYDALFFKKTHDSAFRYAQVECVSRISCLYRCPFVQGVGHKVRTNTRTYEQIWLTLPPSRVTWIRKLVPHSN